MDAEVLSLNIRIAWSSRCQSQARGQRLHGNARWHPSRRVQPQQRKL